MALKYYHSLLVLLILGIFTTFFKIPDGSSLKFLINSGIYISLVSLPLKSFFKYKSYFSNGSIIFYFLILYGVGNILRDVFSGEITSLLGNKYFGPSFLVPLFLLWGMKVNSISWLHRLSIVSVKIGVFISPLSYLFNLPPPLITFYPTFFLLLNYNYVSSKDKIWIVLGIFFAIIFSLELEARSILIRIAICLVTFILMHLNRSWLYKLGSVFLLILPLLALYLALTVNINVFSLMRDINNDTGLTTDTRTFLYIETISDLEQTNSITWGKGPLGTYYSQYFRDWKGEDGDHYIRHNIEVGMLHYLLKGGLVYVFLVVMILLLAIKNALGNQKNKYIPSLGIILSGFLFYSFIENIPSYSFAFAPFWIITGICLSKHFKELNDNQIRQIIQNKVL